MKNNKKFLKAVALSLGLATMMVPATLNAQINRGLLENPYKQDDSHKNHGVMNSRGDRGTISEGIDGITNANFNESETAPLGSGIAVLMGLGLGYVALKRKED